MKSSIIAIALLVIISSSIEFEQLQEALKSTLQSSFVNILFIYDSATASGPAVEKGIEQLRTKREGYYKVIPIDCNTQDKKVIQSFPYCGPQIRPKLPAITFTEPALNSKNLQGELQQPKNHQFSGAVSEKHLFDYAVPLMPLYSVNLKATKDWTRFQQQYPKTPKILYFTDKPKIPPFFKALTANFRNTIAFAHVFHNSSLCQQLGVQEFPTLLLNGKQKVELTPNLPQQIKILRQFEGSQTEIYIQERQQEDIQLTSQNIDQKIYKNPQHIMVHIPARDGSAHPQWKKSQTSFKKMFQYFETDTLAQRIGVKIRPAIVYFPKSLVKKDVLKTVFGPQDNFRKIYDQISSLIDDFTVPLANDIQLQKLTGLPLQQQKFVVILFHKEEISLSYRVLSNQDRFKDKLVFFRMKDPEQSTMSRFKIDKLPSLYIMVKAPAQQEQKPQKTQKQDQNAQTRQMSLKIAHFTGKFNYDDLSNYFNVFAGQEKKEQKQDTSSNQIQQIKTPKQFQTVCGDQSCYLLLLDQSPQKQADNQKAISSVQQYTAGVLQNIGYLDAKCHSEIISQLDIYVQDLPVFIYINSKFQKYSRLVGRLQQQSIRGFTAKVRINKGIWRPYDSLSLQKKDCQAVHQQLHRLQNQGDVLSAQQQQILQQIRKAKQQQKQQLEEDSKPKRGKRRKRRPVQQDSDLQL